MDYSSWDLARKLVFSGSGAMSGTKLTPNRALVNARLGNHQS